MATDYEVLYQLAEEIAAAKYLNALKEIELPTLRIRTPPAKVEEEVRAPFTDDESDGDDESPVKELLEDFLGYNPMNEIVEWLKDYPRIYMRVDEDKGIFYLAGRKRTIRQMAKHHLYQVMLNTIMDMFNVYKVKILPLD